MDVRYFPPHRLCRALIWVFGLVWACQGLAEEKLKLAVDGSDYPPFSYRDAAGGRRGFDVEIGQALCREMRVDCEILGVDFEGILDGLAQRRYDIVVAGISPTPAREAAATFTKHYFRARSVFIGRRDMLGTPINRDTLAGKRLTCQKGTLQEDFLRSHFQDIANIQATVSTEEAFERVALNQADLLLSDTLTSYHYLRSPAGAYLEMVGIQPESEKMAWSSHIQVRKGDMPLRDRINAALDRIRLSGAYHKINQKYFPFSIY